MIPLCSWGGKHGQKPEHDWMRREWGMASACRPSYIWLVFAWLWLPHGYQECHEASCSLRWLKWLAWPRLSHAGRGGLSQFNLIMETLHGVTLAIILKPVFKILPHLGMYTQPSSLISPLPVFLPLQNNTAPLPHTTANYEVTFSPFRETSGDSA